MKIKFILLTILLVVPMFAASLSAAPAEGKDAGVFVPGRFMSLAGAPDGSVYLLSENHQLVCVKPDGSQRVIELPRITESKPTDRLCDLSVNGNSVALCGFAFPVLFVLDLQKPAEFTIVRASDQEAASLHLLNVSRDNDGWRVRDADGYVFKLKHDQPLEKLPDFAALEVGESDQAIVLPPAKNSVSGRVYKEDGRLFWVPPSPPFPRRVLSVDFLGVNSAGCHNFVVMTASGELDSEFTVYAVRHGRVVASQKIPGPAGLEMQRFCRLSPDGSIVYAQDAKDGRQGIILNRISLTKK